MTVGCKITEVPGTDTEMEDRQLSDKNLSDHVQLMKLDLQFEQRLAKRLEEELKKNWVLLEEHSLKEDSLEKKMLEEEKVMDSLEKEEELKENLQE